MNLNVGTLAQTAAVMLIHEAGHAAAAIALIVKLVGALENIADGAGLTARDLRNRAAAALAEAKGEL